MILGESGYKSLFQFGAWCSIWFDKFLRQVRSKEIEGNKENIPKIML